MGDGLEDAAELFVVQPEPALDGVNFASELFVPGRDPRQLDESTHYGDVDPDGAVAAQDAGEHGHALLGEGIRRGPPGASQLEVTNCDFKRSPSDV